MIWLDGAAGRNVKRRSMMHNRTRRGMTFVDVVASLVIGVLLIGIIVPAGCKMSQRNQTIQCAYQLQAIYAGLVFYQREYGHYPQTLHDPDARHTAFTGADAPDPFKESGPAANDVTAALFLLIRTGHASPLAFICPATDDVAVDGKTHDDLPPSKSAPTTRPMQGVPAGLIDVKYQWDKAKTMSNFKDASQLSYSVSNPYPSVDGTRRKWVSPF